MIPARAGFFVSHKDAKKENKAQSIGLTLRLIFLCLCVKLSANPGTGTMHKFFFNTEATEITQRALCTLCALCVEKKLLHQGICIFSEKQYF
jgi:hypothetical protein